MRLMLSSLVAAGTVAGVGGAVVAYQAVSADAGTSPASVSTPTQTPTPEVTVRLRPCEAGWTLRGRACVRTRTKLVVVPAARPAAPADEPSSAPRPTRKHSSGTEDRDHDDAATPATGDDSAEVEDNDEQEQEVEHADHEDEPEPGDEVDD